ncbi:phosphopantetheine-binding protein [Limibaculum sp. FT325]|uniref:phosphopantetheine-binding protein n=1 Tax=Thermohalobaculum sediminis TaxID=2939436 RepID=UPI0020BDA148|nr:phosphopantetheine-binding protein [Limibaculum sediminis]MCL5776417.1 phosphopantetheine-binding protein [Limibaculum sediminis]
MDDLTSVGRFHAFRHEVACMIVEELVLDDVAPEDIDPDAPLFIDGLGLDSIDALELSFAITKRYGVQLRSGDERNREIFSSLDALSRYLQEHRTK